LTKNVLIIELGKQKYHQIKNTTKKFQNFKTLLFFFRISWEN